MSERTQLTVFIDDYCCAAQLNRSDDKQIDAQKGDEPVFLSSCILDCKDAVVVTPLGEAADRLVSINNLINRNIVRSQSTKLSLHHVLSKLDEIEQATRYFTVLIHECLRKVATSSWIDELVLIVPLWEENHQHTMKKIVSFVAGLLEFTSCEFMQAERLVLPTEGQKFPVLVLTPWLEHCSRSIWKRDKNGSIGSNTRKFPIQKPNIKSEPTFDFYRQEKARSDVASPTFLAHKDSLYWLTSSSNLPVGSQVTLDTDDRAKHDTIQSLLESVFIIGSFARFPSWNEYLESVIALENPKCNSTIPVRKSPKDFVSKSYPIHSEDSELGKSESGKSESGKSESGKSESGKSESGKSESGKSESGKLDSEFGKSDSESGKSDSESGKSESSKSEVRRTRPFGWSFGWWGSGKSEPGKPESGKPESGKPESGKPESGKSESGKSESGKSESGKSESGKSESGKPDSGKPDSGKPEFGKSIEKDTLSPMADKIKVLIENGGDSKKGVLDEHSLPHIQSFETCPDNRAVCLISLYFDAAKFDLGTLFRNDPIGEHLESYEALEDSAKVKASVGITVNLSVPLDHFDDDNEYLLEVRKEDDGSFSILVRVGARPVCIALGLPANRSETIKHACGEPLNKGVELELMENRAYRLTLSNEHRQEVKLREGLRKLINSSVIVYGSGPELSSRGKQ